MPLLEPVPDLRSLDLLRSVAELGSIRQAALSHGISQPAASMRLRSLERTLGLALLDRSQGRAHVTSTGAAVVEWSEAILDATRNLLVSGAALKSSGQTQLRVIASMTVAEYLVPEWLQRLRASDPAVVVSLQMGNTQHVIDEMIRGAADMGFVEGRDPPTGLRSRVVLDDDLVVVVAPSHVWARRTKSVSPAELSATPLVLREAGSGTRAVLERALLAHGLQLTASVELGSTTAIKSAVASGAGPGVMSRLAVTSELTDGRLVEVDARDLALDRSIRLVWSASRPLSPAAKRFLRHVDGSAAGKRR